MGNVLGQCARCVGVLLQKAEGQRKNRGFSLYTRTRRNERIEVSEHNSKAI
jgi:hypothetical protein